MIFCILVANSRSFNSVEEWVVSGTESGEGDTESGDSCLRPPGWKWVSGAST